MRDKALKTYLSTKKPVAIMRQALKSLYKIFDLF